MMAPIYGGRVVVSDMQRIANDKEHVAPPLPKAHVEQQYVVFCINQGGRLSSQGRLHTGS